MLYHGTRTIIYAVCDLFRSPPPRCLCRPSSPRRRRINYGENGDYTHYNGNHTPYEQKEKKRPDGVTAHNKPAQSESGRFQVTHHV